MNRRDDWGSARRRTGWLVGGIAVVLLLSAILAEGQPWRSASGGLVDTRWKIDTVRGEPMAYFNFPAFLQFMPHQTIFGADEFLGEDSCNALQGTYEIDGDRVRFNNIGSTLVGCSGLDVMKALQDTRSWRRTGNKLFLYDAAGAVTLGLSWSNVLGIESNPAPPKPTGTGQPPGDDASKVAIESPSATNT